jgi:hypothetical protein
VIYVHHEPIGHSIVSGITPAQMGEFLDLIDRFGGMRPPAMGDHLYLKAWDVGKIDEIFTLKDCPIRIAKIVTGVDSRGFYRDIYHIEGSGWTYQLRHRPDMAYPDDLNLPHDPPLEFQKWCFDGDEKAFVREIVQAKLMMLV